MQSGWTYGDLAGIIEIKCPYKIKDMKPHDINNNNLKNMCYTLLNQKMRLKRTHQYYYQIQFCIAMMDVCFCDFIVWSAHGILIEKIEKDELFIKTFMPKLSKIHRNILLVEFFEMKLLRNLPIFNYY